jgi:hypothetical protein
MYKRIVAVALCLLAVAGATLPAQAGKGHRHHHHRHWKAHVFLHAAPVVLTPSCGHYYAKWQYTGSFFWKRQYFICKGWW